MVNDLVENRALCEIYPLKQNNCNEMVSVRRQAQDMVRPAGLHRRAVRRARARASSGIVTLAGPGPPGDQRRQAGGRPRRRGVRGARLRAGATTSRRARPPQIDAAPDRTARARRALAVPRAQVRQRARRYALRRRRHRACSSTSATSTPPASGGRPSRVPHGADPDNTPTSLSGNTRSCCTCCSAR